MTPRTILIIDDSPTQLAVLKGIVSKAGYRVLTAANGLDGVLAVYRDNPDLVIADVVMPELNGYLLCRLLKNDPLTAQTPIVLLTSLDHKQDRFWGLHAGADGYLSKAVGAEVMLAEVARQLDEAHSRPRAEATIGLDPSHMKKEGIKNQLIGILEGLLFESTLSAEIRALGNRYYRSSDLARGLFRLLDNVVDFDAIGMLLRGPDRDALVLELRGPLAGAEVEAAMRARWDGAREVEVSRDGEATGEGKPIASYFVAPLVEDGQPLGQLGIFSASPRMYGARGHNLLEIVARELTPIVRYLLKLEELEALRREFMQMLTHDLRAPLSITLSSLLFIQHEPTYENWDATSREFLQNAVFNGNILMNMINDLLDLYRHDAGGLGLRKEPIAVDLVVTEAVDQLKVLAQQKSLTLESTFPTGLPAVAADRGRLTRVIMNLVGNAIKFTYKGGITIDGSAQDGHVRVNIRDTGVGIPTEASGMLFRKFYQVGSLEGSARETRGIGLGLAFCKQVIEAHGGEIGVEPMPQGGSNFYFTLPVGG